jgi:hypothetical protein
MESYLLKIIKLGTRKRFIIIEINNLFLNKNKNLIISDIEKNKKIKRK